MENGFGDRIFVEGIRCRARLGVPPAERAKPQTVLIDVTLWTDLRKPGVSDEVHDTVDYWELEKIVRRIAQAGEFKLAERLADVVAKAVLRLDPRIRSTTVAVHKKPAIMPKTREVVVEISRRRS